MRKRTITTNKINLIKDNRAAVQMAKNPGIIRRRKCINIRYHCRKHQLHTHGKGMRDSIPQPSPPRLLARQSQPFSLEIENNILPRHPKHTTHSVVHQANIGIRATRIHTDIKPNLPKLHWKAEKYGSCTEYTKTHLPAKSPYTQIHQNLSDRLQTVLPKYLSLHKTPRITGSKTHPEHEKNSKNTDHNRPQH